MRTYEDLEVARQFVSGLPRPYDPNRVVKKQCSTCPWRKDGQGITIPDRLMAHLQSSPTAQQFCHAPAWAGKPEDSVCRGFRDHWALIFWRTGVIDAPTDEAWAKKLTTNQQKQKES